MQDVDRPADVEPLSEPARHRCPRVQVKAVRFVPCSQHSDRIAGRRGRRRALEQQPAVWALEAEFSVELALDLVALLVNCPVVSATQERQV